jgi:hypothetical protein
MLLWVPLAVVIEPCHVCPGFDRSRRRRGGGCVVRMDDVPNRRLELNPRERSLGRTIRIPDRLRISSRQGRGENGGRKSARQESPSVLLALVLPLGVALGLASR